MKVTTWDEARACLDEKIPYVATVRPLWAYETATGLQATFLVIDDGYDEFDGSRRTMWHVGPRGAVNRGMSFDGNQWNVLTEKGSGI